MKSIFLSKTFWYNLLSGLALFFALPEFTNLFGPDTLRYVLLAHAAVNILLRYVTVAPVSVSGQ